MSLGKLKALLGEQRKAQAALDDARAKTVDFIHRVDAADRAVSDYLAALCEEARNGPQR